MKALVDTSVLVRRLMATSPGSERAKELLEHAVRDKTPLVLAPQVLYELWVVLTRPASDNGYGVAPDDFDEVVRLILLDIEILPDPPDLVERWLRDSTQHGAVGKQSHDARIVARMEAHDVEGLLTFNPRHFAPYTHLQIVSA